MGIANFATPSRRGARAARFGPVVLVEPSVQIGGDANVRLRIRCGQEDVGEPRRRIRRLIGHTRQRSAQMVAEPLADAIAEPIVVSEGVAGDTRHLHAKILSVECRS